MWFQFWRVETSISVEGVNSHRSLFVKSMMSRFERVPLSALAVQRGTEGTKESDTAPLQTSSTDSKPEPQHEERPG